MLNNVVRKAGKIASQGKQTGTVLDKEEGSAQNIPGTVSRALDHKPGDCLTPESEDKNAGKSTNERKSSSFRRKRTRKREGKCMKPKIETIEPEGRDL